VNIQISPAPVKKRVTVKAPPKKAFEVFTAGFSSWWPSGHKIGAAPWKETRIEPHVGGRWYEVGTDGSECEWGEVLTWEPPHRLVLAWRISLQWQYDPELLTEVDIRFTPTADGGTLVELEHRKLENMGPGAAEVFGAETGWSGLLVMFAEAAGRAG
jgi:uncharacterized protein YndB with AHSA1/START domain